MSMIRDFARRAAERFAHMRSDSVGAYERGWAHICANLLDGDYYEFGVYRGNSLALSFRAWRRNHRKIRNGKTPYSFNEDAIAFERTIPTFYAFDTYAGMPANDEDSTLLHQGSFMTSMEIVRNECGKAGLLAPQLQLVEGLFADNAARMGKRPAAFVHIDCDLYASTVDALRLVKDNLVQGSVVMCDDYNLFRADRTKGQRRAIAEFLAENPTIELEPWFAYGAISQAFLVHRTSERG